MPRRSAADAARTRTAILERAVDLASLEGLEGLTIGRLAADLEMSKAGVLGHFGTKEELQLAALGAAREVYRREIWDRLRPRRRVARDSWPSPTPGSPTSVATSSPAAALSPPPRVSSTTGPAACMMRSSRCTQSGWPCWPARRGSPSRRRVVARHGSRGHCLRAQCHRDGRQPVTPPAGRRGRPGAAGGRCVPCSARRAHGGGTPPPPRPRLPEL